MKTFKELQVGEVFKVENLREIISNRGDIEGLDRMRDVLTQTIRFQKRDEWGANSIYKTYGNTNEPYGCYYRIEPDNPIL